MKKRISFSCLYLDWTFNEDEFNRYKFRIKKSEHDFTPKDKVLLCVDGRPDYHEATLVKVFDDGIVVQTLTSLDVSEAYSIISFVAGFVSNRPSLVLNGSSRVPAIS